MSEKDYTIFIKHILNAINDIEESVGGLSKTIFKADKDKREATIRRIEVIGEAVKNLPNSFKDKYLEINWKEIVGTRDKLIHHYFGVDIEIVWDIVKINLPKLKKQLKTILNKEKNA